MTKYISKYHKEGYLSNSRRIYSALIDSIILIIVTFCLLIGSNKIVGNTSTYASRINNINNYRIKMYELTEEAKLYEFKTNDDGSKDYDNLISQNEIFKKYALSNVLYTYNMNKNKWDSTYSTSGDNPLYLINKYNIEAASYENDYLATFFVTYAEKHNKNNDLFILNDGETYKSYFKKILKNNSKGSEWEYREDSDILPSLKLDYAYTLFKYIENDEGGQEGLNSYNYLMVQYQNIFEIAANILFNSSEYQTYYSQYKENYRVCSMIIDVFCLTSYLIGYLLCIILPVILLKKERTLGLLVNRGVLINKDGLEISSKEILIYLLTKFFAFFPVMLFSCFFAGGLDSGWVYPIFSIGNINISLFNLTAISFIFPVVDLILTIVKDNKQDIGMLLSSTIIVDTKYYTEHIDVELIQKEEKKIETIIEDKPYFDSSSFNNTERNKIIDDKNKDSND